ncbi:prolipoprotein diacylglyceryl transferase [Massilia sp. H-1]|nr:prolipoprotein diacylglyceryl transferase [Massilia sp. H-1]
MPDPIAIHIGSGGIHWYGLMYVLAFGLFLLLGRVRIKQPHIAAQGWQKEDLDDMLFYGMLGVVIGGRLGEVLFYQLSPFPGPPGRHLQDLAGRHVLPRRLPGRGDRHGAVGAQGQAPPGRRV